MNWVNVVSSGWICIFRRINADIKESCWLKVTYGRHFDRTMGDVSLIKRCINAHITPVQETVTDPIRSTITDYSITDKELTDAYKVASI